MVGDALEPARYPYGVSAPGRTTKRARFEEASIDLLETSRDILILRELLWPAEGTKHDKGNCVEGNWVLHMKRRRLQTPEDSDSLGNTHSAGTCQQVNSGERRIWLNTENVESQVKPDKKTEEAEHTFEDYDAEEERVLLTALRRQVRWLQQKYDHKLEVHVAKAVAVAGGRSAPKAATIKLYRQYERLMRVVSSLQAENERLVLVLEERQRELVATAHDSHMETTECLWKATRSPASTIWTMKSEK